MLIASFDIGKKNFAFCIEYINTEKLKTIKNNVEYLDNGEPTENFSKTLDEIYKNGEIVVYENTNLLENCKNKNKLEQNIFHNMTDVLDNFKKYWIQCEIVIIEKQMRKNHVASKLGQHCYSYFLINYGRFKTILEFPSYYKTQKLGCGKIHSGFYKNGNIKWKCVNKNTRKKWAVEKTKYILNLRDDKKNLQTLYERKKKDDLADVICQLQSFKVMYFIEHKTIDFFN
jgi:hypothetical protein